MSNQDALAKLAEVQSEIDAMNRTTAPKYLAAGDRQEGGSHYKNMPVQPWDVIDGAFPEEEAVGFYRGNALKYLLRNGAKGKPDEDIRKAIHYLQKLLEVLP